MQVAGRPAAGERAAIDGGPAVPVRLEEAAEAVLEDARRQFELVPRPAAAAAIGGAVQIIELGHAVADQHLVGEAPGVEQRHLDAAAARAAEAAAAAAAPAEAAAAAGAADRRRRRPPRGRVRRPGHAAAAEAGNAPALRAGRWRERLLEVEAPAQLAPFGAGEIDRPGVDLQQPPVRPAQEPAGEGRLDLGRRDREARRSDCRSGSRYNWR